MSLNSLESEGLRPLCSLGLLWCSLGQIWPLTIAVQFCCFWFHVGLLLLSESQISVLVPWQQKFQGSFWLCFGFWPLTTCPHLQLSYSSLKGLNPCYCSGTWVAVRTAHWQGGMLCYEDKMPLNVSPYRKDLLWLSSSHFFCRITNLSWLESLVVWPWANVCICWEGLQRQIWEGFCFFTEGEEFFFQKHWTISAISASLGERCIEYLTLEPLLSPDVCFAHE